MNCTYALIYVLVRGIHDPPLSARLRMTAAVSSPISVPQESMEPAHFSELNNSISETHLDFLERKNGGESSGKEITV